MVPTFEKATMAPDQLQLLDQMMEATVARKVLDTAGVKLPLLTTENETQEEEL